VETYNQFAEVYATGGYPHYSQKMAELLPDVLGKFNLHPRKVLDLACGEGTFAVALAKLGYQVTGYDKSNSMLGWAKKRAGREGVQIDFRQGDMRDIPFQAEFDLVTSWYDSLNYLLTEQDLKNTFQNVYDALVKEGSFVFDMNTIHQLAVNWQTPPSYIQRDDEKIFEVHRTEYDQALNIASLHIIMFFKVNGHWRRVDELHKERGYPLNRIKNLLHAVGFTELACWDDPQSMSKPQKDSGRLWFVVQK